MRRVDRPRLLGVGDEVGAESCIKTKFLGQQGKAAMRMLPVALLCVSALVCAKRGLGADYVRGYTRSNGTYVAPYYRTHPDHTTANNWSTYPNVNPYTGQVGTYHAPTQMPNTTLQPTPLQLTPLPWHGVQGSSGGYRR